MADIIRPIEPFELTQGFGENPANYAKFGLKGHNGWDLRTKYPDTPQGHRNIMASWLMKLYRTGVDPQGYGNFFETICQLKSTWKLTYGHCLSIESFDTKKEGETMAISDNTGNSTGSHLHLTVKRIKIINGTHEVQDYNNGYFGAVNPQEYFDELRAYKKANGNATLPKENINMTIDEELFRKLVDGSTVRKELSIYLRENGGTGFDDPDNTPLTTFKSHYQGKQSYITSLENDKKTLQTDLAKANTEVDNQKDKLANVQAECQRQDKLRLAEIDKLKQDVKNAEKQVGSYTGTISSLEGQLRDKQKEVGTLKLRVVELETQLANGKNTTNILKVAIEAMNKLVALLRRNGTDRK